MQVHKHISLNIIPTWKEILFLSSVWLGEKPQTVIIVKKNATHKESSREKNHIQEPPSWPGKHGSAQTLGQAWLL
jgi:hypothetical protein